MRALFVPSTENFEEKKDSEKKRRAIAKTDKEKGGDANSDLETLEITSNVYGTFRKRMKKYFSQNNEDTKEKEK